MAGIKFNWGIAGVEGDSLTSLLFEPSLVCYQGRQGGAPGAPIMFETGGVPDQIEVSGARGINQKPVKKVYFGREIDGIATADMKYDVRIEYDIVTLTTQEQADLYQRGLCR